LRPAGRVSARALPASRRGLLVAWISGGARSRPLATYRLLSCGAVHGCRARLESWAIPVTEHCTSGVAEVLRPLAGCVARVC
jgi:hypothetical protein